MFFPDFNTTTGSRTNSGRTLMMPERARTRAAQRAQHIQEQRALTAAQQAKYAAAAAE